MDWQQWYQSRPPGLWFELQNKMDAMEADGTFAKLDDTHWRFGTKTFEFPADAPREQVFAWLLPYHKWSKRHSQDVEAFQRLGRQLSVQDIADLDPNGLEAFF